MYDSSMFSINSLSVCSASASSPVVSALEHPITEAHSMLIIWQTDG